MCLSLTHHFTCETAVAGCWLLARHAGGTAALFTVHNYDVPRVAVCSRVLACLC